MFDLLALRSELKDAGSGLITYGKQRFARRRVLRYLPHLSDDQRGALQATMNLTDGVADRPVYWQPCDGESCPVLLYLGFFLDEGAIRPIKYSPPDRFGYRFAPWFHRYLQRHPEVFSTVK
jgi:hypothetical protein